ncbi:adenylate kinase 9 [Histomonas meleagridis]|uniref:adenylate kinase 9 n=1 Tax=Histomonas meleagridis TaxID=135588 RepID=UPI00355A5CAF|nr:adenylate kinase 9 [Histomonas meleagridis]KAH0803686.1 adenylate kinase 9 [Histomonas meleagridis]
MEFSQRVKRREFIGKEKEDYVEEEEDLLQSDDEYDEEDEEEILQLYTPPNYETTEERFDETNEIDPDDEETKKRLITLPEESESQIIKKFEYHENEKKEFNFQNITKKIIIDATQPLKEMSNIVCDKASIIIPCIYPMKNKSDNEEEDINDNDDEVKYSIIGEKCLVSLIDDKKTIDGNEEFTLKFNGYTFLFANNEYLERFAGNPQKYLLEFYHSYHHKILLIGGKVSGKKTIQKNLSEFFESEIVDFETLIEETKKRIPKKKEENSDNNSMNEDDESYSKDNINLISNDESIDNTSKGNFSEQTINSSKDNININENINNSSKDNININNKSKDDFNSNEESISNNFKSESDENIKIDTEITHEEEETIELQPIFTNGYISIVPTLDVEPLKVFKENELLSPDIIIILDIDLSKKETIIQRLPNITQAQVNEFIKEYETYNETLKDFIEDIKTLSIKTQVINGLLPIDEVFWNAAYSICPLLPRCNDEYDDEPTIGYLGTYCPVTLKDKNILQSGDLTLVYDGSQFSFSNEENQERFRNAPLAFIKQSIPNVPPPRILIIGTRGSSKTSIANEISRIYNVNVYEFPEIIINNNNNEEEEEEEEMNFDDITKKLFEPFLKQIINETNNQRNGWIIEGTPKSTVGAQMMIDYELKPDLVFELEQNEQWALMRNRKRLNNDEDILNEESEDQIIVHEFSSIISEESNKGEPIIIDTSRRFTSIMKMINRVCLNELTYRKSLFVSQSSIELNEDIETIFNMLKTGNVFMSQFGRYCPICLKKKGQLIMTDLSISCKFLSRIFFFETKKHQEIFMNDPLTYVFQTKPPNFPIVPKISILGNSELCLRLSKILNTELIRPRDVITRVVKQHTPLGMKIREILSKGKAIDSNIFRIALKSVLLRHDCQIKGYIIDGYPTNVNELNLMKNDDILPTDLIFAKDNEKLIEYAIENYHNVIQLMNESTIWLMTIHAINKLNDNIQQRWKSILAIDEKRPYCVSALNISPEEVSNNLSKFKHFCPVSYSADNIYVSSIKNDWENIVKYNGNYYHLISSEYKNDFLISPIPFIYNWSKNDIKFTNIKNIKNENVFELQIDGYDVVELSKGNFVKGLNGIFAEYESKLFLFSSEVNRNEFCYNVSRYLKVKLPENRPVEVPKSLMQVSSMPTVAYLEQSVGDVITECIVKMTLMRPKIPNMSLRKSLNEFVATYIKANVKDRGDLLHEKFERNLMKLIEKVELAEKLKKSLETPMEMRDEEEHERLCKLWNDIQHKK